MDSSAKALIEDKQICRAKDFSRTNCAGKFEKNAKQLARVQDAKVNLGASRIDVYGSASVQELEKAGAFGSLKVFPEKLANSPMQAVKEDTKAPREKKVPFYEKHNTLLFATLLIAFGYLSHFVNGEDNLVTSMLLAGSVVIGRYSLFEAGFQNLIRFDFNMKALMTVAVIGAAIIGEWAETSVVVILFAISRALERFSMDRARQSIRLLMDIALKEVLVMRNDQEIMIYVDDTAAGGIMAVKPGEKIAVGGIIINGVSAVSQAAITGESTPVVKMVDGEVPVGALNEEGLLEVKIARYVEDTTVSKIVHLVEEVQGGHVPTQAFVDKFTKYYTLIIMVIVAPVAVVPPLPPNGN